MSGVSESPALIITNANLPEGARAAADAGVAPIRRAHPYRPTTRRKDSPVARHLPSSGLPAPRVSRDSGPGTRRPARLAREPGASSDPRRDPERPGALPLGPHLHRWCAHEERALADHWVAGLRADGWGQRIDGRARRRLSPVAALPPGTGTMESPARWIPRDLAQTLGRGAVVLVVSRDLLGARRAAVDRSQRHRHLPTFPGTARRSPRAGPQSIGPRRAAGDLGADRLALAWCARGYGPGHAAAAVFRELRQAP